MPALSNEDGITRLIGVVLLEADDEWAVARRHMSLGALARVMQTNPVRLPTAAAWSASALSKDRRSHTTPRDTTVA